MKLEVAILEVNNNLKISVHPVLVELRKDLIIINEGVEDKLKEERARLDEKFVQGQTKHEEIFEDLTVEMKAKVDEHAELLKYSFGQDLKQQLVIHRKNMIDAVETKCFNMDNDLDNIKLTLDRAIIVAGKKNELSSNTSEAGIQLDH